MTKIVLQDTNSGHNLQTINDNFRKIEDEFNKKVLYRDNPVGEPNEVKNDLDMNGKRVYNLPPPTLEHEAARFKEVQEVLSSAQSVKNSEINARNSEINARNSEINARNSELSALDSKEYIDDVVENATALLGGLGYQVPVLYTSGLEMVLANQTVTYNGQTYAPIADELPFTTSGTFEVDKFRLIQGVSGADLAAPYGAAMVGFKQDGAGATNVQTALSSLMFNSVSEMKSAPNLKVGMKARTLGYYAAGDGGGCDYEIVAGGTGSNYGFLYEQLAGSGLEAKLLGGGIMENKTVYLPDDFSSYQDALFFLSGLSFSGGATVSLVGRSGWEVESGVFIIGGDYSRFIIKHEDPVAYVADSFPAGANLFGIYGGATGPTIDCLFDMKGLGVDAFNVNSASKLVIRDDAGVTNAGRNAVAAFNGSIVDAADSILTNSRGRTIWASGAALVNAQNADLSGGNIDHQTTGYTGAITSRRNSVVNIQGSDISNSGGLAVYCIRASTINCDDCTCNGGSNVFIAQSGATISAKSCDVSNITGYLAKAEYFGRIDVSNSTLTGAFRGLIADGHSEINADGVTLTGNAGSSDLAINSTNGSIITANNANIADFDIPFRAVFGATIVSIGATISGSGRVAVAIGNSKINIRNVSAPSITGRGIEAESLSEISCEGANIASTSNSNIGVSAEGGSTVSVAGASISGFNTPLRVFSGSKIYARRADLTGNVSRSAVAGGFSQIWAHNATTDNSATAGDPNVADFSVGQFNTIYAVGAVWA